MVSGGFPRGEAVLGWAERDHLQWNVLGGLLLPRDIPPEGAVLGWVGRDQVVLGGLV